MVSVVLQEGVRGNIWFPRKKLKYFPRDPTNYREARKGMEEALIAGVRGAKGDEAKRCAVKELQAWRRRERMIAVIVKRGGSAEAADAAIAAEDAKLEADRVRARERELGACGDRRALEFQSAPAEMGHRTDQGR